MSSLEQATINSCSLYQYNIALTRTLLVAKQRIDHRQGLILLVTLSDQHQAWVEIAPLWGIDINGSALQGFSQESLAEVTQQLLSHLNQLVDQPLITIRHLAAQATQPSLAFGLSLLYAKLSQLLPVRIENRHIQSVCVPLVYSGMPTEELHTKLRQQGQVNSVKVKVAQTNMADEIAFIYHILDIAPQVTLRLDANRGFSAEQAIDFLACLPANKIEYIEEPCINPADNGQIYHQLKLRYALDESLNDTNFDVNAAIAEQPGLGALIIKPMLLGSLDRLQDIIEIAHSYGVRCILSSSLESHVGINDLRLVSQALTPDESPGLDTLTSFSQSLLLPTIPAKLNVAALQLIRHVGQPVLSESL